MITLKASFAEHSVPSSCLVFCTLCTSNEYFYVNFDETFHDSLVAAMLWIASVQSWVCYDKFLWHIVHVT